MMFEIARNEPQVRRFSYATLPIRFSRRRIHILWLGPITIVVSFG